MSVLINMEMPTSCDNCEFCKRDISGYDWCCIPMTNERSKPLDEPVLKPDWCPLVPVPEHGRLIDADVLDDILADQSEDAYNRTHAPRSWERALSAMRDYLDDAPTIIPAEEATQKDEGQDEAPAGPYDLLYEEGGYNSNGV